MRAFKISRPHLVLQRSSSITLTRQFHSTLLFHDHVPSTTNTSNLQNVFEDMKKRPSKFIYDHLQPMPSHLLNMTLDDLLGLPPKPQPEASSSSLSSSSSHRKSIILPQGHHLVYFPIQLPPSALAPDGADPAHSPGKPFTRRVWAGGRLVFHHHPEQRSSSPLVLNSGTGWLCREEIRDVRASGSEGREKVYVDVCRSYGLGHHQRGDGDDREWDIEEVRTLAFMREDESSSQQQQPRIIRVPRPPVHSITVTPSSLHLFYFSALSFNAHAIHYDPTFARDVDGHKAVLVHGPLLLALMLRVLNDHVGVARSVREMSYRNLRPLYVDEPLTVCVGESRKAKMGEDEHLVDVWVQGPDGGLAVKASTTVGPCDGID